MDLILKAKRSLQADWTPAAGAFPHMKLGVNVEPFAYYTTSAGPNNMLTGGAGFGDGAAQPLDVNGWPTTDFIVGPRSGEKAGASFEVTISFSGKANVGVSTQRGMFNSISAVAYNASTNRSTCTTTWTPTTGLASLCGFTNTQRTAGSAVNTGVTDVDMRATAQVANPNVWSPRLTTYLSDFATCLRTMDLQDTNNDSYTTTWASRRHGSLNAGSIENCVALAIECNVDLWMQIPMLATPDWDNAFFTYVRDNLPANRIFHFGFCNETWNGGFGNSHTVTKLAAAEVGGAMGTETTRQLLTMSRLGNVVTLTVDYALELVVGQHVALTVQQTSVIVSGTYAITAVTANSLSFASVGVDGTTNAASSTWFVCVEKVAATNLGLGENVYQFADNWAKRRLLQAAERCRVIVGDAAMLTRFRPILEVQGGSCRAALAYAKAYLPTIASGFTWATQKHVYGVAGAPYMQLSAAGLYSEAGDASPPHTVADYVAGFAARYAAAPSQYEFQQSTHTAESYGVRQLWYEGGADNYMGGAGAGAANTANITAAKGSQGFADAHLQFLSNMGRSGTELYMHYHAGQSLLWWGFTDDYSVVTPYWQAFRNYKTQPAAAPQNIIAPTGTTVIDGRSVVGTWDTNFGANPMLGFGAFDNVMPYCLFLPQTSTKTLVLSLATTDFYGGTKHFDLMVNGTLVAANILQPALSHTLDPFTPQQFVDITFPNVVLPAGFCWLEFRAKENHFGGSNEAFQRLTFS